jgi:hypothetical protein
MLAVSTGFSGLADAIAVAQPEDALDQRPHVRIFLKVRHGASYFDRVGGRVFSNPDSPMT